MKRLARLIVTGILFALPLGVIPVAHAQIDVLPNEICNRPDGQRPAICDDDATNKSNEENPLFGPKGIVTKGVSIFAIIVGIAAVFVIVISGLRFVTSNGDSNSVNSARNAIIYALIGVIIAALAQVFVNFVLSKI